MFDIDEFKSTINHHDGLLRNNKFMVTLLPPPILQTNSDMFRDMSFFAEHVNLPGVSLNTGDVRRYGYGPVEKRPYSHNFTDLNTTYLLSGNADTYNLMQRWISAIAPFNMNNGINDGTGPYLLHYKNEYVTDIRIKLFTDKGEVDNSPLELIVREAFPVNIADLDLIWQSTNEHARFTVTFSYVDWFLEESKVTNLK